MSLGRWAVLHRWAGGPCYVVGQVGRVTSLGRWAVLRRWAGGPCYIVGQVGRAMSLGKWGVSRVSVVFNGTSAFQPKSFSKICK